MHFERVDGLSVLDDLVKLAYEIYAYTNKDYPRLEWLDKKPEDFEDFCEAYRDFLKNRVKEEFDEIYVSKKDKKIVACFAFVFGAKDVPWINNEKCMFVELIMVHPSYQKLGLGREIIEFSWERAKRENLRLCISTFRDIKSYGFYLKNNFKEIEEREGYVIMEKTE